MNDIQRDETPRCTAKAKGTGERCKRRPAIGSNVCAKHGARGGRPATNPATILKNALKSSELREKAEIRLDSGQDVLDLQPIAAMLQELADEVSTKRGEGAENMQLLFYCLDLLGKTAERVERIRASKAFTNSERDWFVLAISEFVETLPEGERPRFQEYIQTRLLLRSSSTPKALPGRVIEAE